MYEPSIAMDSGTKAYIIAVYSDLFPCVVAPGVVIYAAPSIRSKLTQYILPIYSWITVLKKKMK